MILSPSLEDYLEAIWVISKEQGFARVKEIANQLKVRSASVVKAMKTLAQNDLVTHDRYSYVKLTDKGIAVAQEVYRRHRTLTWFLAEFLKVNKKIAVQDACQMEHHVHKETLEKLIKFMQFIEQCPEDEPVWLRHFHKFAEKGEHPECCKDCRKGTTRTTLDKAEIGIPLRVVRVVGPASIRRRLMDLGIISGVEVKIEKVAPLGDPIDIQLRAYHLSLRKEEAVCILVEPVE